MKITLMEKNYKQVGTVDRGDILTDGYGAQTKIADVLHEPDAALIAAAPALLEALRNIAINLAPGSKVREYFGIDAIIVDSQKRAAAAVKAAEGGEK